MLDVVTIAAGVAIGAGVGLCIAGCFPHVPDLARILTRGRDRAGTSHAGADLDGVLGGRGQGSRGDLEWVWRFLPARLADALAPRRHAVELELTGQSVAGFAATRLACVVLGLVFPPVLVVAMAAVGLALPWTVPTLASVVLAGVLFWVPEVDLHRRASAARHQMRLATCAYAELVALERAGDAGVIEALERAATISTSPAFSRIHDALVRAELAGHPPWQGLSDLAARTGVPELGDVADIMATSGRDGAAVYATLRARAAALRTHLLTNAAARANATSEHLIVPVALLGIAFMALVGYPAFARVIGP